MSQRKDITLETLQGMFHMPEKQVAAELGICLTSLKKIARNVGITRWPFRKLNRLRTLEASMKKMNADTSSLTNLALAYAMNGNAALPSTSGASTPAPALPIAAPTLSMKALSVSETIPERDEDAASSRRSSTLEDEDDETPSCFLSSMDLIVTNWSALWTVKGLKKNLMEPMGGTTLYFSTDGTTATLCFPSKEAAVKAQNIVTQACASASPSEAETRAGSEVSSPTEQEDEASPEAQAAPAMEPASLSDFFSNMAPPSRPSSMCMSRPSSTSMSRQPSGILPCSLSLMSPASSRPSSMDFRPSSMEFRPSSMEFSDMLSGSVLLC